MEKLNYKISILISLFSLFLINIIQVFGEEVEGSLYPIEIEENQIREEKFKRILGDDETRAWNNCFSDDSSSKEKTMLEKQEEQLYSSEDN